MRVLVIGRPPSGLRGYGVERYSEVLLGSLSVAKVQFEYLGDWNIAKWFALRFPAYGPKASVFLYEIFLPTLFLISRSAGRKDIVHYVDISYTLPSALFARLLGCNIVATVQSLNGITYLMVDPEGASSSDSIYVMFRRIAFAFSRRFVRVLLTVSSIEEREVRRIFQGVAVKTVSPGTSLQDKRHHDKDKGSLVLGCAGALVPSKRIDRAIRVLGNLKRRGVEARLLVSGEGRSFFSLRSYAEKLGLLPNVSFVGHTAAHMEEFYAGIDFLLFPSLRESFGFPIVEAARCMTLVVTFDDSVITPESKSLALSARDEDESADIILKFWRDRAAYSARARETKERAGVFSKDHMASELVRIYAEILRA